MLCTNARVGGTVKWTCTWGESARSVASESARKWACWQSVSIPPITWWSWFTILIWKIIFRLSACAFGRNLICTALKFYKRKCWSYRASLRVLIFHSDVAGWIVEYWMSPITHSRGPTSLTDTGIEAVIVTVEICSEIFLNSFAYLIMLPFVPFTHVLTL